MDLGRFWIGSKFWVFEANEIGESSKVKSKVTFDE
ncbi:hypothetical protein ES288_D13G122600v1 [Gossypium darwinii]|uniref:Uncharacterized protein n=2 Tax=Gossypium TaxID=3633 RepID=A0A5D2HW26_GOSTO|nr:hypothetical protein ES288_D13G122600v1 [Gossypium darwinii]TYH34362.1 hypothetical protein ES332_D13G123300v1 [Gossypium tomentosum]